MIVDLTEPVTHLLWLLFNKQDFFFLLSALFEFDFTITQHERATLNPLNVSVKERHLMTDLYF